MAVDRKRSWTRDGFLISMDHTLIPLTDLNGAFDSDFLYWAQRLPESELQSCLENSLNFGLYSPTAPSLPDDANRSEGDESKPALIGFARLITDSVTFAYLTDVYVLPEWRGRKLGEWLIQCVHEVTSQMPHLRRVMAILGDKALLEFYRKIMGLEIMDANGPAWVIQRRGPGSSFA
jgi:GNAT superfamily N-acetyltransferase